METTIFKGKLLVLGSVVLLLLMVQKSGDHEFWVGSLSHYLRGFISGIIRFIKLAILGEIKQCDSP